MPEVGLIITVEDKAGAVLSAIGNVGKSALDKLNKAGEGAGKALKIAGASVAVFNQALEIGKKAVDVFRVLILENVRAMVEYRGEADSISKKFKEIGENAQFTRSIITDLLTPAILGVAEAWDKTGSVIVDYIKANRRLIATNIVNFLVDISEVLIKGIAEGFTWVSRGVSGFFIVINSVAAAVNALAGGIVTLISTSLRGFAKMAELAGQDGLAKSLFAAADEARGFGDAITSAAADNVDAISETIDQQEKLEEGIEKVRALALTFTGEARVAMLKWANSWDPVNRKTNEATWTIRNQQEAWKSLEVTAADVLQRTADLRENDARLLDAQLQERAQKTIAMQTEIATETLAITEQSMAIMTDSTKEMGEKTKELGKLVLNTAKRILLQVVAAEITALITKKALKKSEAVGTITANASAAAAGAAAAVAPTPFVGPVLAPIAAAETFASTMAYVAPAVAALESGGILQGSGGIDSALARLTPGKERVLSERQTLAFENLVKLLDRGQVSGAGIGGGPTVINQIDQRSFVPRRGVEFQRSMVEADKVTKKLQRRGRLK